MFKHLFFISLNCFLRIIFVMLIIFLLFYYAMSLPYPYPSFFKFFVSLYPAVPYPYGHGHVRASKHLSIDLRKKDKKEMFGGLLSPETKTGHQFLMHERMQLCNESYD